MAHFKPQKVSSLQLQNVMYAWTTPVQAPPMTPAGGGGEAGWGGETLKWSKGGLAHSDCVLAVRLPSPIVSSNKIKEDYKLVYLRQSGTLEQWNQWSCPSHLEKKTAFMRNKRINDKKGKKEGKAVRTNWKLFFVALVLKIWKGTVFYT